MPNLRQASTIAGSGLLLMSALAGFGYLVAIEGLVTPGDAASTAADIIESEGTFRLGIVSLYLVVALDVVVAWALFQVFRPVSPGLSLLAAWFRLAFAAIFMVAIGQLVGVLRLLGDGAHVAAFTADQRQAQALLGIDAFTDVWDAGLILFGLHLLVIGYLAYRSGAVPKVLGVLLAIAGGGYLLDSLRAVLSERPATDVATFTFIGEFLLALWLLLWGRRTGANFPPLGAMIPDRLRRLNRAAAARGRGTDERGSRTGRDTEGGVRPHVGRAAGALGRDGTPLRGLGDLPRGGISR